MPILGIDAQPTMLVRLMKSWPFHISVWLPLIIYFPFWNRALLIIQLQYPRLMFSAVDLHHLLSLALVLHSGRLLFVHFLMLPFFFCNLLWWYILTDCCLSISWYYLFFCNLLWWYTLTDSCWSNSCYLVLLFTVCSPAFNLSFPQNGFYKSVMFSHMKKGNPITDTAIRR